MITMFSLPYNIHIRPANKTVLEVFRKLDL